MVAALGELNKPGRHGVYNESGQLIAVHLAEPLSDAVIQEIYEAVWLDFNGQSKEDKS